MAKPIIKIKRGNARPNNYSVNTTTNEQNGLTAGELGVNVTANQYSLYVGNNTGTAITFGAEIDATALSSITNPSDFKISTQKAVKDYIDLKCTSTPQTGTEFLSYIRNTPLSVGANATVTIPFNSLDFGSITSLSYDTATGIFTYSGSSAISLLVIYQITWDGFTSPQSYSNNIVRSAWIQKSGTANQNVYGFSTFLCPPSVITTANSITGTQQGIGLIRLNQNDTFSIQVKNHSGDFN